MSNQNQSTEDNANALINDNISEELPSDIFMRQEIAAKMCELICSNEENRISPAVLDGPWGCGKTIHALRMMEYLNANKLDTHKCIYWNVSEVDFSGRPLAHFVSALYYESKEPKRKAFKKLAYKLLRSTGVTVGINVMGGFFSKYTKINVISYMLKMLKLVDSESTDDANTHIYEMTSLIQKDKNSISCARELIDFVREGKELVVIVDELDRCRPSYALEMIEIIKHLFSIQNCKFLFVMNKCSIISSISHMYGLSTSDATMYLNKYVKLDLYLPRKTLINTIAVDNVAHYYDYYIKKEIGVGVCISMHTDSFIAALASKYNLQLREIEKLASMVRLLYRPFYDQGRIEDNQYVHSIMLFVAFLTSFRHDILEKLYYKSIQLNEILEAINCNHASLNSRPAAASKQHENFFIVLLDVYLNESRQNSDNLYKRYEDAGYEELIYNHIYQYVLEQTVKTSQYLHV